MKDYTDADRLNVFLRGYVYLSILDGDTPQYQVCELSGPEQENERSEWQPSANAAIDQAIEWFSERKYKDRIYYGDQFIYEDNMPKSNENPPKFDPKKTPFPR